MGSKRAPRLQGINDFELGWINLLKSSHLNGFLAKDACIYLSTQRNQNGRRYRRIPDAARMNAILKKSSDFYRDPIRSRQGYIWWKTEEEE